MRHVLVLLVSVVLSACRRSTLPTHHSLSPVQVADRTRPATVSLIVRTEAVVELADLDVDRRALIRTYRAKLGRLTLTHEQIVTALVDELLQDPAVYMIANSESVKAKGATSSLGSGLIVTSDGYVATNAHVVEPDEGDTKAALISSLSNLVDRNVASFERSVAELSPGQSVSSANRDRMQRIFAKYYADSARFVEITRTVDVVLGYTTEGNEIQVRRSPCKVVKIGKVAPGKDVAICKMEGRDFPTLQLASNLDEAGVRTGADLFVVGYPGALAVDKSFTGISRLEPSMTTGHVSGIRETTQGWKVIQTDATISPGNSGGPALNEFAQVVGLATFTLRGERTQNLNFVVSVDIVREFLRDLNVLPAQSSFSARYERALDAFESGRFDQALTLFRALYADRPESGPVRDFLQRLNQPVKALNSRSSPPTHPTTDTATFVAQAAPASAVAASNTPARPRPFGPRLFLLFVLIGLSLTVTLVLLISRGK